MAKLTKYEKETIILFNEGEDTAHIQTYNAGLRKRLAAFSKKHPDLCRFRPGRCDLCAGQVQTVYPAASAVQRGTQAESMQDRKANRVQEPYGLM